MAQLSDVRPAGGLVSPLRGLGRIKPGVGTFVISILLLALGFYIVFPIVILLVMSFNVATDIFVGPARWGLDNWTRAWEHRIVLESLRNSFLIWFLVAVFAFPISIAIALVLARTRIPFSHGLEYMFWVAFMFPSLASTIGWIMLMDPDTGMLNHVAKALPFVSQPLFNIYSVQGIVWAKLMGDGIAFKVMLLTPAFRNMDAALEEAARVGGASKLGSMLRVTLPMMISPIVLILCLQLVRVFQGFETEQLLGPRWGFYVYSTLIYRLANNQPPQYGEAVVLASITFLLIAAIIPFQGWVTRRRHYTTIASGYRPGLMDLGRWKWIIFGAIVGLLLFLTVVPTIVVLVGSFMSRVGFFEANPLWTLKHWQFVFTDAGIVKAFGTTLILALTAGICSPILFSLLAYVIVRTRLRGRGALDSVIWGSAAIPGILSGLGLLIMFLMVPGLNWLYGSIWALILVVIVAGKTTGVNVMKGVFVQLGKDMEESSRVAGAGWFGTYFRVVLPILMPTMVLIGVLNFVAAAGATSSIILLASRDTYTLSLLVLQLADPTVGRREAAGIISLIIMVMTLGVAWVARAYGFKVGVRQP
jgi:iron(III) transport system permease protein